LRPNSGACRHNSGADATRSAAPMLAIPAFDCCFTQYYPGLKWRSLLDADFARAARLGQVLLASSTSTESNMAVSSMATARPASPRAYPAGPLPDFAITENARPIHPRARDAKSRGMKADLFANCDPLLSWLPDETLFSLCSRHHRLWGYATSSRSTQVLFGHRRAGTQHDLPSSISQFAARTDGHFGSDVEIARDRTLLRFYRPFVDPQDVQSAVQAMCGPSVAHLKFGLGLLTSRFRAHHPLKACMTCLRHDVDSEGWAYWHLQHQFPGVWVCPEHGEPLLESTVKSTGVERFLWHLPTERQLATGSTSLPGASLEALAQLARLITSIVERIGTDGWLAFPSVQATLRRRLFDRGWMTSAGSIRLQEAAGDYMEHCRVLRSVPELSNLPSNVEEAKVQLGRLIRPLRSGTHPLRLLLAIDWLFDDLDAFVAMHTDPPTLGDSQAETATVVTTQANAGEDDRRARLLGLLGRGESATAAARSLGIDIGTAMAWAAAAGVAVGRRPKILNPKVRQSLVRDLRVGLDKIDAAGRHGVSVETVTRVLRTEIGLHAQWVAARTGRARQSARQAWLDLLAQQRSLGVKLMRASNPAAYAWLYRNDRQWLREHTPSERAVTAEPRASSVRWDERDAALSLAVRRAAVRLSQGRPGKPIRLWQIFQAVPELKPKLAALERLPLTRRALESALGRSGAATSPDLFD
jgi:hypothetical protein